MYFFSVGDQNAMFCVSKAPSSNTGPGAMGFQPGIFREKAGEPAWSPLWDHFTVVWNDPDIGIDWGVAGDAILSDKDAAAPALAEFDSPFTWEG